jgi:hypothetical protein
MEADDLFLLLPPPFPTVLLPFDCVPHQEEAFPAQLKSQMWESFQHSMPMNETLRMVDGVELIECRDFVVEEFEQRKDDDHECGMDQTTEAWVLCRWSDAHLGLSAADVCDSRRYSRGRDEAYPYLNGFMTEEASHMFRERTSKGHTRNRREREKEKKKRAFDQPSDDSTGGMFCTATRINSSSAEK